MLERKPIAAVRKRPTNISLSEELVAQAKEFNVPISEACERGLALEVKKAREAQWIEENMEAIKATNEWVEKNGLPLAKYRMF